jgi:hypothetical protein
MYTKAILKGIKSGSILAKGTAKIKCDAPAKANNKPIETSPALELKECKRPLEFKNLFKAKSSRKKLRCINKGLIQALSAIS